MKIHLVDGTYELFRTFYGAPPAHDAEGRPVGALRALVSTLVSLVSQPDVLLLDEPTNHLDIDSIEWLETFLREYAGALLFVTHDRALLRSLATRIVEIDRGALRSYPGDYDAYLATREAEQEAEALGIGDARVGISGQGRAQAHGNRDGDDVADGGENAGDHRGNEELGDIELGEHCEDDEDHRGRNKDAERAAGCQRASGEGAGIAVLPQLGQGDLAHRCRRGEG